MKGARTSKRAQALLALLLVGATGCTLLLEAPGTPSPVNRCSSDEDCAEEARCEPSARLCVVRSAPSYAVRVELTPTSDPIGGEPVPIVFELGPLDAISGDAVLVAPVQVPVQGTIRNGDEAVAAQITFSRRSASERPDLSGALAAPVTVRAQSFVTGPVDFVTQLPGGASYDVYVEPQSEFRALLPPLSATLDVPEGSGVSFAIDYAAHALSEVRGVVLDTASAPVPGLLIRMVDSSSGRTLSSSTSTDAEGRFSLVALEGLSGFAFRVRGDPSRADATALFPRITIEASALVPSSDGSFTLLVPSTERSIRLEGRVELPSTLGMNAPARGAQVHLDAPNVMDPSTGLVGGLDLDLTTDAEGRFVGRVLPGDYRVEIVSSDAGVGVLVSSLEVLPTPSGMLLGQLYTLPERSILGGTVELSDGEPFGSVPVRAEALGVELVDGVAPEARLNRTATGLTGSRGEYRLPLDVGQYDLAVELPPSSGYAWHVERDFVVERASTPLRRSFVVRAPHRLGVVARFAEGTAIAGGRARLFALHPETGRAIEIGEATTDADGRLEVLLPASLD